MRVDCCVLGMAPCSGPHHAGPCLPALHTPLVNFAHGCSCTPHAGCSAHTAVNFTQGKPFRPFEQLLGVLPAPSSSLLPAPYKPLMEDATSPIIDFYPLTFEVRDHARAVVEGRTHRKGACLAQVRRDVARQRQLPDFLHLDPASCAQPAEEN